MSSEAIRELLKRQPFTPFKINLSSGQTIEVRHPEFVFLTKSGIVVGYPDSDRVSICAYLHIANIDTVTASQAV
jgi:hypothetical protein